MLRWTKVSTGSRRDGNHGVQSSLVESLLEFRKGEPLAQTLLLQESVVLHDPPKVTCQS